MLKLGPFGSFRRKARVIDTDLGDAQYNGRSTIRGSQALRFQSSLAFGNRAADFAPGRLTGAEGGLSSRPFTNRKVLIAPGIQFQPSITAANPRQIPKVLTIDLSVSVTTQVQNITGTILWLYRVFNTVDGSPNLSAFIKIRIADIAADDLTWYGGNGVEGIPFQQVFISIPTTFAGVKAELAYLSDTPDKPVRFF